MRALDFRKSPFPKFGTRIFENLRIFETPRNRSADGRIDDGRNRETAHEPIHRAAPTPASGLRLRSVRCNIAMLTDGDREATLSKLEKDLYNDGFDIFHPFHPQWYNESLKRDNLLEQLVMLPEVSRGFLIGNTKHLWPTFKKWYEQQSTLLQDPLDTYCRECIESCLRKHYAPSCFSIYWSAKTHPNQLISMQRVSMESGLAYHDPTTQLVVHPMYGTWHSYRAVVILKDDSAPQVSPPRAVPCLLTPNEKERAKVAMKRALAVSNTSNLCVQLHGGGDDADNMMTVCQAWIEMRDCIERGKSEYRFDEDQLMYHYTKDIKFLNSS